MLMDEKCCERVTVGNTEDGMRYIREFGVKDISTILVMPDVNYVGTNVCFWTHDDGVMIIGAFAVGYRGTGPSGLVELMREAGFDDEDCKMIYNLDKNRKYRFVK